MGQGVSRKKHGKLTLGYLKVDNSNSNKATTTSTTTTTTIATTTDLLLERPEDYGLLTSMASNTIFSKNNSYSSSNNNNNKSSRSITIDDHNDVELALPWQQQKQRPDSGYVEDNRLVKELAYIDTTYYLDTMTLSREPEINNNKDDKQQRQQELTLGDIISKNDNKSIQALHLSCRHLTSLNCTNLYYLTMIQKLDLSRNHLTHLPESIGSLVNLTVIQLAHNRLTEIPDTVCGLVNLIEFDLGHNQLTQLTPYIGHLKKLTHLNLNHNHHLSELPIEIGGMKNLSSLSVLHCPQITMLPAEMLQLPNLRRIRIASANNRNNNNDRNGNNNNIDHPFYLTDDLRHNPPSLREICARKNLKIAAYYFPHVRPKPCTACGEPYFESYVSRRRLIERPDSALIIFEYRLCSAHWTDDDDRMRYVFNHTPPSLLFLDENGKNTFNGVLQFLPPIVAHKNTSHININNVQQQLLTSTTHQEQRITTIVEEEKVITKSRWRLHRFFKRSTIH